MSKKIEKLIAEAETKLHCEDKVEVTILKRKDFKKELSNEHGVGIQDLKKKPKKLFTELMCKGHNVSVEPITISRGDDLEIGLYITKK
jgi:hypothetical protein